MIESYEPKKAPEPSSVRSDILTLQRDSVIVLRCSFDHYDLDEMNTLRDYYQQIFPNNRVCVMFDNIDIEVIHDKSLKKARPCAEVPYDFNSYNYT